MRQGDIYWCRDPNVGSRPVVILTRSRQMAILHSVIVAPITSTLRDTPTHVPVGPEHGLHHHSVVALDNMTNVDKDYLGRYFGSLDNETLNAVYEAIKAVSALP